MSDTQRRYADALIAYAKASLDFETAWMNGSPSPEEAAAFKDAGNRYAQALQALVKSREVPSFEVLLADPTSQYDPTGAILKSIQEYRDAPPASASVPVGPTKEGKQ